MCLRSAILAAPLLLSLAFVPARGNGFLDQVNSALDDVQGSAESTINAVGEQVKSAQSSTISAIDGVKHDSEKAVVKALLWASGKCTEIWKLVPEAPAQLAQKLSEDFASSNENPSANKASCRAAAQAGFEDAVDGQMGGASDQEKSAVKTSLQELMGKVCTDDLMETLQANEDIRRDHKEQYKAAVDDRLRSVITEDALRAVVADYCGDAGEISRLFAERPSVSAGASAPLGPVALLGAAAVLLAASVVAARRSSCSMSRLFLGRDRADEAERGLMDCVE